MWRTEVLNVNYGSLRFLKSGNPESDILHEIIQKIPKT